jgi:DNA-binding MarR family transcriptional regulator
MSEREEFVALFREIHPKFSRLFAKMLDEIDLTLPQYTLLNQLALLGSISMTEISGRLGITKPAVTNLVDRLEEKKLLERVPHPDDRRISLLNILPRGQKAVAKIQAESLEMILKAYDRFGSEEHKVISRFYATLSGTVDEFLGGAKK